MSAIDRLLDILLATAVADIERKTVDFEFRLPKWALATPEALCLEPGLDYEIWRETCAPPKFPETPKAIEGGLLLMKFRAFPLADGRWFVYGRAA